MNKSSWKRIGTCAVDSGMMMLVDPCYVLPDQKELENTMSHHKILTYEVLLAMYELEGWDKEVYDIKGLGFAVSSGYGDGSYDVFIKTIDEGLGKRVSEMKIVFIEDVPEEEGCYGCGWAEADCQCEEEDYA